MTEFITRGEYQETVRRLDEADVQLRKHMDEVENTLRQDYEEKITAAVKDMKDFVGTSFLTLGGDVKKVQDHLSWQDRLIVSSVSGFFITVLTWVVLRYAFHI